jgi:hypothetical protein
MIFDALLRNLEADLRFDLEQTVTGFTATARTHLEGALAEVAKERTNGLADIAKERDGLYREIATMRIHNAAQKSRVVLDIGGARYTTSVQTLRRLPNTFFDAYLSGRYAIDRSEDGSIYIDRDGEHFGQVLEYLRDGVLFVAERDPAELDVDVLRWLKREFGFYCIEVATEPQEVAFAVGGSDGMGDGRMLASIEQYEVASGAWQVDAPMAVARNKFCLCKLDGELYVTGGMCGDSETLASVERYDPNHDTWCAAPALPRPRHGHCACTVGDAMYVIAGIDRLPVIDETTVSSLLMFDSRTQTWSEAAPMPEERESAAACVLGSDIYVFGGYSDHDIDSIASTTYRFSTESNTWATLAPMPEAKYDHKVCVLRGLLYVMGGWDGDSCLSSVHRYNPVENSWSDVAHMSVGRAIFGAFVLGGSVYAVGGDLTPTSMELYCVATNSWSEVSGGKLGEERDDFSVHTIHVDVNFFDNLIAKAERARQLF